MDVGLVFTRLGQVWRGLLTLRDVEASPEMKSRAQTGDGGADLGIGQQHAPRAGQGAHIFLRLAPITILDFDVRQIGDTRNNG